MWLDDNAVGGFFEDLTVLLFVLVGVSVVVAAGIWTAEDASETRADEELDLLAEDLLTEIMGKISPPEALSYAPTVDHIRGLDLPGIADAVRGDCGFCIGVTELYPEEVLLCSASRGLLEAVGDTGFAAGFVNALDPDGMVVMVEVKVLVWQSL